jgi:integrase
MPGFGAGKAPRNKGQRYPADPPTVDEIVAVMRRASRAPHGNRLNGLIGVLWRAGLRINEALSLIESDLDQRRGLILARHVCCSHGDRAAALLHDEKRRGRGRRPS